jgi:hypothetical protein
MMLSSTFKTQSANGSTINCALLCQEGTQYHGDPSRTESHAWIRSSELSICHCVSLWGEFFTLDSLSYFFRLRPADWWFGYRYPLHAWWATFCLHSTVSATDPSLQNDDPSMVNRITGVPCAPSSMGAVYFVGLSKGCSRHSFTRAFMSVEPTESEIVARYRDARWVMVLSQYGPRIHLASTGCRGTRKGEAHCSVRKSYANHRLESCWFSLSRFSFPAGQI